MDDKTKDLCGSKNRDKFRHYRKQAYPKHWYACDGDLFLVDKYGIICYIDFKYFNVDKTGKSDKITWAERITYTDFVNKGIPVYIVEGTPEGQKYVYEFIPTGNEDYTIKPAVSFDDYYSWEENIRAQRSVKNEVISNV